MRPIRYLVTVKSRIPALLAATVLIAACSSPKPVVDTTSPSFFGAMPADFSGSWERDYSRGEDAQGALNALFMERQRQIARQQQIPSNPRMGPTQSGMSRREANALLALARLVQDITKPEVLTISQDDYEIRVAREDDFAMSCSFYDGVAQRTDSPYGTEVCSWDGNSLISHLVLPATILGTYSLAYIARMTRSFMLDQLNQEYVLTARVKGLSERDVIWRHAFRNVLVQLITIIGLTYASLLEGSVLTETVFAWPGIGQYITVSLFNSDMNAVLGGTIVVGISFIGINMLSDLLYKLVDPRAR